jgi:hypothetical protein
LDCWLLVNQAILSSPTKKGVLLAMLLWSTLNFHELAIDNNLAGDHEYQRFKEE